jgi:hypothetical protein
MPQRQLCFVADRFERKATLDMLNTLKGRQLLIKESLIGLKVWCDYAD